jgi:hypothetical protein
MKSIKEVLIARDNMTEKEAEDLIRRARNQMWHYLENGNFTAAQEVCGEYFGLEPDYIEQLI